ncbi:MAG TPA: hypothetical protein VIF64_07655 [Pyrinomonadaceae bacterium]|jgi:hypothetical protein
MAALAGAVGGLTGALVGMGIPEYEAKRYEGKIKEGNNLISVHAENSDEVKRAKDIFERAGARTTSRIPKKKTFPSRKKGALRPRLLRVRGSKSGLATFLGGIMKIIENETGAMGWILLWAIGIPVPILRVLFMVRGCT